MYIHIYIYLSVVKASNNVPKLFVWVFVVWCTVVWFCFVLVFCLNSLKVPEEFIAFIGFVFLFSVLHEVLLSSRLSEKGVFRLLPHAMGLCYAGAGFLIRLLWVI